MNLFAPSVLSFFLLQKKKSHFPRKKKSNTEASASVCLILALALNIFNKIQNT